MFKYFSRTEQIKRKRCLEQQIIAKGDIQAILEAKWKLQRINGHTFSRCAAPFDVKDVATGR